MEQKFNTMTVNIYSDGLHFHTVLNPGKYLFLVVILEQNN